MIGNRSSNPMPNVHRKPKRKTPAWQAWTLILSLCGTSLFCGFSWGRVTAKSTINVPVSGPPFEVTIGGEDHTILTTEQYRSLRRAADESSAYRAALGLAFRSTAIPVTATAYNVSKRQCGNSKGITATGTKVRQGRTIAVSRRLFPLLKGKRVVLFDGEAILGIYIVEDKMHGKMRGNRVDVYLDRREHAEEFGVRKLHLVVLEA